MLTRFRANPRVVRVSVRRFWSGWRARVTSTDPAWTEFESWHKIPYRAVVKALCAAARAGMPGVDLSMGWSYEHPQHPGPGVVLRSGTRVPG